VGVATIARGRARHLERQAVGVGGQSRPADRYVVVAMDRSGADAEAALARAALPPSLTREVRLLPVADGAPLPLATARNAAIAALGDVDLAILVDVDCIPHPQLVARYLAADAWAADRPHLLAGPVGHLPPGRPAGTRLGPDDMAAARVRGRPVPGDAEIRPEPRHELFWSLSFAVRPATHARIGGFDEAYRGYGAEDTDYARRAARAGVALAWAGGAWAYHQDHGPSGPVREHVEDIVRNARVFHERWGVWPMEGWLERLAAEGLVDWRPEAGVLRSTTAPRGPRDRPVSPGSAWRPSPEGPPRPVRGLPLDG
jgi:GT2 family glycosyltransferase